MVHLERSLTRSQGRIQADRQDPECMLLLGSIGRMLQGSWAKGKLVSPTKRNEVLVCYVEILSEGYTRLDYKGCWEKPNGEHNICL